MENIPLIGTFSEGMQRSIANANPLYKNQQSITDGGAPSSSSPSFIPATEDNRDYYSQLLNEMLKSDQDYSKVLINPTGGVGEVMKQADIFGSKASGGAQEALDKYLIAIDAPSSVEEVQKRLETDALTQTLADIDRDIAKSIADVQMTGEEYGISGAGFLSEPVISGIAQAGAQGARTKASARTELLKTQLAREAEKEKIKINAYGEAFKMYPQLAQLDAESRKTIIDVAEAEADRIAKQELGVAELDATRKNNLINNLFKQLQTMDANQLEKTLTQWKIASNERIAKQEIDWAREKYAADARAAEDSKTGFWEGLGQNILTSAVGGVTGGLAKSGGEKLGKLFF